MKALCAFYNLPVSTFYYHRNIRVVDSHAETRLLVREVFAAAHGRYGYRRVKSVLNQRYGVVVSGKTVLKLMREEGLLCQVRRKKYRSYRGEVGKTAPNVLKRDFKATAPNQKWVTDVTEFVVAGTKQYFSPVIDLFNSEVVAYALKPSPSMPLVNEMLNQALKTLPADAKPVIHSDQGWQYQHISYRQALNKSGLKQSMSRKGNCLDNAMAENFFGHFKEEFLRRKTFTSLNQFKVELDLYMNWYNQERIQLKLEGLSPVEYRTQSLANLNPTPI